MLKDPFVNLSGWFWTDDYHETVMTLSKISKAKINAVMTAHQSRDSLKRDGEAGASLGLGCSVDMRIVLSTSFTAYSNRGAAQKA
jgi:hypothetical protein